GRLDRATARFSIGLVELIKGADSAQAEVILAEAPGADAGPGEVLGGIANVAEFPVEYAPQSAGPHHDIADTKIAMNCYLTRAEGRVAFQPAQGPLENGMRFAQFIKLLAQRDDVSCRRARCVYMFGQEGEPRRVGVNCMNACKLLPHLRGE